MNKLQFFEEDHDDGGNPAWITIYRTKKDLTVEEVIELCKTYIREQWLNYDPQSYKDNLKFLEINYEERPYDDAYPWLEIHWTADEDPEAAEPDYDCWFEFRFRVPREKEEKEGWVK